MTTPQPLHAAICGAGLAGLGLALSLNARRISCTVYEVASKPTQVVQGSLNLAPNGQAAVEAYGILPKLAERGCFYRDGVIRNLQGNAISKILVGHKDYFKYDAMRIMRAYLIEALVEAARECGIPVECNKKLVKIVSESSTEGVKFEFEDGSTATASLLVGADGIHSRVRATMYPDVEPKYIGMVAITSAVNTKAAGINAQEHTGMILGGEYVTLLSGAHNADHSEFMFGIQKAYPDLDRAGWKKFGQDKKALKDFVCQDYDKWPAFCQREMDYMQEEHMFLWPMRTLPSLPSWISRGQRVLLIGDAAHAMPPSGGQGANQAFEDSHTLGLVLEQVRNGKKDLNVALKFWQDLRMARINDVVELTMQWNKMRRPGENTAKTMGTAALDEERIEQMRGIYGGVPPQEEKIRAWAQEV